MEIFTTERQRQPIMESRRKPLRKFFRFLFAAYLLLLKKNIIFAL